MERKDFRSKYLYSLLLTVLGCLVVFTAIISFIFGSLDQLMDIVQHDNADVVIFNMLISFFKQSLLVMLGVLVYFIGMIWNIVVSFQRGIFQKSYIGFIVLAGWLVSIFIPGIGWLVSIGTQIYGWIKGSEGM